MLGMGERNPKFLVCSLWFLKTRLLSGVDVITRLQ